MSENATTETLLIGVGMPASMYLDQFGHVVNDAFGAFPYLVGSATRGKQWRDVDVRLILADEDYDAFFGAGTDANETNPKWCAYCMAFAELGRRMTGLPVDFQIQRRSEANRMYPHGFRQPLIMPSRMKSDTNEGGSGDE